jgi:glutathione S-transferase
MKAVDQTTPQFVSLNPQRLVPLLVNGEISPLVATGQ